MIIKDQLVLSDLHLYTNDRDIVTNNHKLPKFLDYLYVSGYRFRKIILLGDIFEDWFVDAGDEIRKNPRIITTFLARLDLLLADAESIKIFVKGNHDSTSMVMRLDPVVAMYLMGMDYQITEKYEDSGAIYVHGHQGSISRTQWFFQMLGCKILYFACSLLRSKRLYRWFYNLAEKKASYRSADPEVKRLFYQDLIRRLSPGDNVIVFGHTHVPMTDQQAKIVNTGDWMEHRTFVIRDGNTFVLYSFETDKFVEISRLLV